MSSFLTPRLFAIAKMVDYGDVIADIGTDHAYLPIYLAKDNKAKRIYACDINSGPLENAKNNINAFGVADKIELIQSDGLSFLSEKSGLHLDQCIIAGMGSNTILEILEKDSPQVDCYILASNTSLEPIRNWVKLNKYYIEQETIVFDNDIFYEVLKVNKFAGVKVRNKFDKMFGPILRRNINNDFIDKWMSEEEKILNILHQIPKAEKKYQLMSKKMKMLRKFINKELKRHEANQS